MLMFLRLINGIALRKVDSGLKMLIEPIFYWLVSDKLVLQESVFNKNYLCFRKTELA